MSLFQSNVPFVSHTSSDRWGDYYSMTVDPEVPSVFYFTGQTINQTSGLYECPTFKFNPGLPKRC